jgi:hypothetical protein
LIIDLTPKDTLSVSLYEVTEAWGYSNVDWTPIMLHLRGLFIEHDRDGIDARRFERELEDIDDPIFSMMYLRGSVRNGKLAGRWTPPGPSSTNSVLLWPESLQYFVIEAAKILQACRADFAFSVQASPAP